VRIDGYQPDLLRSSVMQVLKEPSFREQAAALGENIRKSQGTSEAVEWILTHIEEKRQADFP
jgi:UDP:flavonoid glycosyltransferase YjiC (YdhE family)